jgi:DNA-binding MarR family transcriptional regulator
MEKSKIAQALFQYNSLIKENDKIYRNTAKTLGISDSAFWILYMIRESDQAMTQSELCSSLYQPKQTINSALKKLEQDGVITLKTMDDRRSKQLILTEKGRRLSAKTVDRVMETEQLALAELTEEELTAYLSIFSKHTSLLRKHLSSLSEDCNDGQTNQKNKNSDSII